LVAALDLRIDELVLHGFAPSDRDALAAAVERELTRLLADEGLPAGLPSTERFRVDGGAFTVRDGAGPDAVGAQVARAVYQGLAGLGGGTSGSGAGANSR
jgi:hypothetical protein